MFCIERRIQDWLLNDGKTWREGLDVHFAYTHIWFGLFSNYALPAASNESHSATSNENEGDNGGSTSDASNRATG